MAVIVAGAIAAAGALAGAGIAAGSANQAAQSAKTAGPPGGYRRIPLPGYADAINRIVARGEALNIGKVPPSFDQYVESGGTELFPYTDPGMTPQEVKQLGLVDKYGKPTPFVSNADAAAGHLNPEQMSFLAQWYADQKHGPGRKFGRAENKRERKEFVKGLGKS